MEEQTLQDENDDISLREQMPQGDGTSINDLRHPARSFSTVRSSTLESEPMSPPTSRPDYLHEKTLEALSSYLLARKEHLDEDLLANHMVHTYMVAADRIRHAEFGQDSEEEEGLDDVYRQEEDKALAQEFFKQAVIVAQESVPLDKRTIKWIRKEMGLITRKDEALLKKNRRLYEQTNHSEDSGEQPSKRLTRTQARNTRVKKREERSVKENEGLKHLFAASQELEKSLGNHFVKIDSSAHNVLKPPRKRRSGRRRPEVATKDGHMSTSDTKVPMNALKSGKRKRAFIENDRLMADSTHTGEDSSLLAVTRKSLTPVKVTKVMIDGMDVNDELKKGPTTPTRMRRGQVDGVSMKKLTAFFSSSKHVSLTTPKSKSKNGTQVATPTQDKDVTLLNRSVDTPISLSLLEWRRRHQWTPTKEQRAVVSKTNLNGVYEGDDDDDDELRPRMLDEEVPVITLPVTYKDEGIDLRLPTWEMCNPVGQIAFGEPPVTEPYRVVYTNEKYALWCVKMIDSLTGSARSWARHEFFYSDIDRPWFNFNEFQTELAKHGISPTVKLTRQEWSAVRKAIRGRPRRFSSKFVRDELVKLNNYRHLIRMMQHTGLPRPPHFGYEVYSAVKIGHIVTAYTRRFRILQRGTVLTYDANRKMYLIQFERTEVGFEFVLDIDVASHGLPELLYEASEVALDETLIGGFADKNNGIGSMLYGTLYGKNSLHSVNQQPLVQELAIRDDDVVVRLNSKCTTLIPPSENTYIRPFLDPTLVEKVAEREIVTKLVEFIDKALKRKMILLEAMDSLNQRVIVANANDPSSCNISPDFKQHYAWLLANYEVTTECFEALMVHLQVMFGRGYAGYSGALYSLPNGRVSAESTMGRVSLNQPLDPNVCEPWIEALTSAASEAASLLPIPQIISPPELSHLEEERGVAMQSRLLAGAQLLMATNYTASLAGNIAFGTNIGSPAAAYRALKDQFEQLSKVRISFSSLDSLALQAANDRRASAIIELRDAIECLSSEVVAKHAVTCLQAQHEATFAGN